MICTVTDIDSTKHYWNLEIKNIIKIAAQNMNAVQNMNRFCPLIFIRNPNWTMAKSFALDEHVFKSTYHRNKETQTSYQKQISVSVSTVLCTRNEVSTTRRSCTRYGWSSALDLGSTRPRVTQNKQHRHSETHSYWCCYTRALLQYVTVDFFLIWVFSLITQFCLTFCKRPISLCGSWA